MYIRNLLLRGGALDKFIIPDYIISYSVRGGYDLVKNECDFYKKGEKTTYNNHI